MLRCLIVYPNFYFYGEFKYGFLHLILGMSSRFNVSIGPMIPSYLYGVRDLGSDFSSFINIHNLIPTDYVTSGS